ncbi:MAG: UvrY/SirA/GacA family response regulator transcription factor [Pseudomonadota bacterium]
MIKVMLVDDHELVRMGIARVLEDVPDIDVISQADCGEAALEIIHKHRPDVVLMDINMPGIGGMEATRKLLKTLPDLKIIILTVHADGPIPNRLLQNGVYGYLTKGCAVNEIVAAIREVYQGKRYIGAEVAKNLVLSYTQDKGAGSPFEQLSQRELQVVMMVLQGLKTQEISDQLNLSPKTVSTYRHRIFEKLEVNSDVDLANLARKYGFNAEESLINQ